MNYLHKVLRPCNADQADCVHQSLVFKTNEGVHWSSPGGRCRICMSLPVVVVLRTCIYTCVFSLTCIPFCFTIFYMYHSTCIMFMPRVYLFRVLCITHVLQLGMPYAVSPYIRNCHMLAIKSENVLFSYGTWFGLQTRVA